MLVDPGPGVDARDACWRRWAARRRARVLLTHIHFDHAGASGALVRRWPELPVYVHERGAPHMASPERLVASAARLYGGEEGLRRLWGEVVPVPEANLHVLTGGETVLGDFRVEYTPGHASHHVSFLHKPTGTAFVGDVAACGSRPTATWSRRRRRPTSTSRRGSARSTSSPAGSRARSRSRTSAASTTSAPHLALVRERLHEWVALAARHGQEAFVAGVSERVERNAPRPRRRSTSRPRRPSTSTSASAATWTSAPGPDPPVSEPTAGAAARRDRRGRPGRGDSRWRRQSGRRRGGAPDKDRDARTPRPGGASPSRPAPCSHASRRPRLRPPRPRCSCSGRAGAVPPARNARLPPFPRTTTMRAPGTLDLAVAKSPATDPSKRIGSLFFNLGGPGAGAANYVEALGAGLFPVLNARFDIVGVDPRGHRVGSVPVDCKADQETQGVYSQPFTTPFNAGRRRRWSPRTGLHRALHRAQRRRPAVPVDRQRRPRPQRDPRGRRRREDDVPGLLVRDVPRRHAAEPVPRQDPRGRTRRRAGRRPVHQRPARAISTSRPPASSARSAAS